MILPASRMLKMTPSVVLSRPSPCNVPQGYASVAELPAASLGCHFEHSAGIYSTVLEMGNWISTVPQQYFSRLLVFGHPLYNLCKDRIP